MKVEALGITSPARVFKISTCIEKTLTISIMNFQTVQAVAFDEFSGFMSLSKLPFSLTNLRWICKFLLRGPSSSLFIESHFFRRLISAFRAENQSCPVRPGNLSRRRRIHRWQCPRLKF